MDLSGWIPDEDRLIGRLQEVVRIPSENPPGNEAAVAEVFRTWCESLGLETEVHEIEPGRPSVIARWNGAGGGPKLTYCSHIDVVPAGDPELWDEDPFSARVSDGFMYGRGTADAKGPCIAALEAVEVLRAAGFQPAGDLQLAFVADEETMGFKGAGGLVERGIMAPDVAVVGEPTSLRVVRGQRGASWLRIRTRGVAGHGSAPERGVNAVRHMAEIVRRLEDSIPDVTHPLLGGPTISVGTIRGGEKVNIIPAGCVIEVDRRTVPGETTESVLDGIRRVIEGAKEVFPDLEAVIEVAFAGQPFEVPEDADLVGHARASLREATGEDPQVIGFRGASDARFLAEAGAGVILLGPGDIALAHTARERVELAEVAACARAYTGLFVRVLGSPDG